MKSFIKKKFMSSFTVNYKTSKTCEEGMGARPDELLQNIHIRVK
jgi:hypothetical protein